jgi:hypothetical protein
VIDMAFLTGIVRAIRADPAGTLAATHVAVEPHPQHWMPHFSAACRVLHAWAAVELGVAAPPATEMLDMAAESLAELDAGPTCIAVPGFRTFYAAALMRCGRPDALDELRRARRDADATWDRWWLPETLRLLAAAETAFGDPALAPDLLEAARAAAERQGTRVLRDRLADAPPPA